MTQTPTSSSLWNSFCCALSTYPGWTQKMTTEVTGRILCYCCYDDDGEDEGESFCGVDSREISFSATGYDGKKGTLELETWNVCGLWSTVKTKGIAQSEHFSCLCCLASSDKGKNSASDFWSYYLLGNGCISAKGEHSGCGLSLGFFEAFCGSTVRKCTCFLWESGCQKSS
jgi:hypothetical protein